MTTHHEMADDSAAPPPIPIPTLRELEATHIAQVLRAVRGNQRHAARVLGITRWSLARRLRKYALRVPSVKGAVIRSEY